MPLPRTAFKHGAPAAGAGRLCCNNGCVLLVLIDMMSEAVIYYLKKVFMNTQNR